MNELATLFKRGVEIEADGDEDVRPTGPIRPPGAKPDNVLALLTLVFADELAVMTLLREDEDDEYG